MDDHVLVLRLYCSTTQGARAPFRSLKIKISHQMMDEDFAAVDIFESDILALLSFLRRFF